MNNKKIKKVIEAAYGDGRTFYKLRDSWSRYTLRKFGSPCRCGTVTLYKQA
ncbi:hypothetical protein LRP50_05285 [Enterovibrio sp. ZSDZ42]|uniref:Uncharacterized protein n=1 Tax=Enterovibrio gelatinilyticus TaxID=2899819 RepID=A0ABT5QX75_9GAMM|nr:hypothetical protein [Enterovibrio sp. ZSDZ42]MDD1792540.1 hypothetical protein [Enterovibrio sp. ZSDZ42]